MAANLFGERFQFISFGESHGVALGVVIEGCPAGVKFNKDLLIKELNRRRPGQSALVSARNELDEPEVLSGVFNGLTLGTPIAVIVRNMDARSRDYDEIEFQPRAGHADDLWRSKFGHSDHRGGGRASGRETLTRVISGAVAKMIIQEFLPELQIFAFATTIGPIELTENEIEEARCNFTQKKETCEKYSSRLPNEIKNKQADDLLQEAKQVGKSYGGIVHIYVNGAPVGLGQPVSHKLKADLASAVMSIGAISGVEFGVGRGAAAEEGSSFHGQPKQFQYGGIRGGISTGETIQIRTFLKPTATVLDVAKKGRHDPCIVIRAIPVLEAMVWVVLADHLLWQRQDKIR